MNLLSVHKLRKSNLGLVNRDKFDHINHMITFMIPLAAPAPTLSELN